MRIGLLTGGGDCPAWGMMVALRSTNIELVALSDAVAQLRTVPVEEYERYGVLFG